LLKINNKSIGSGNQAFIVAEVGQSHEGSLDLAHAFIDAVSETGVDAIKFQTHIASAESTLDEQFRIQMRGQDKTRFDYWKRMEFSKDQWIGLKTHAEEAGLVFLSSPFSIEAVTLLDELDMQAWKIGSGEIVNINLLQSVIKTGKPILLSTGMSDIKEIDSVVEYVEGKADYAVFQCTSQYPSRYEDAGLNVINIFQDRYKCPIGLSDHTGTIYPSIAALARGADLIEFHITLDRRMSGPDVPSSITVEEAKLIVEAAEAVFVMDSHPVDKNIISDDLKEMRRLFNKSLALIDERPKGTVLTREMLTSKKPGSGIPYEDIDKVIGRSLNIDVPSNRLLQYLDLTNLNNKD
jgi:N,N'-diacetyllegionaminate synthase